MWSIMIFSMSMLSLALSVELQAVKEYHSSIIQKSKISNRQADLVYQKISKKTIKETLAEKIYGDKNKIDRITTLPYSTMTGYISNRNKKIAIRQLDKKDTIIKKPIVFSIIKNTIKQKINTTNEFKAKKIMSRLSDLSSSSSLKQHRQNYSHVSQTSSISNTNIQDTIKNKVNSFLSEEKKFKSEISQFYSNEEVLQSEITQYFSKNRKRDFNTKLTHQHDNNTKHKYLSMF